MKMERTILSGMCFVALSFSCASATDLPELVNVRSVGAEASVAGGGKSEGSLITPDGNCVLFVSTANNLVTSSNGAALDSTIRPRMNVFLRNRAGGTNALISVNVAGCGGGNDDSVCTGISTNGQFALFESAATDLIAGDTNSASDVFIRDAINGTTELISVSTNGGVGNGASRDAVMTPDGRFVVFVSSASNLVPDDTNGIADVFVRDRLSRTTTLVSVGAMKTTLTSPLSGVSASDQPEISADGRYVAFLSTATNLVAGYTNVGEIYLRDTTGGTTYPVSFAAGSVLPAPSASAIIVFYNHVLSDDGQFVAFESSWLVGGFFTSDGSTNATILRYNLQGGGVDIVSTNALASVSYKNLQSLDMTPDGRFITFVGDLSRGAPTNVRPVFIWDAQTAEVGLVSADVNGLMPTNFICQSPTVSDDGRFVSFLSTATNLTADVVATNDTHLYVRDLTMGSTRLVDINLDGSVPTKSIPNTSSLSPDGRFISFDSFDAGMVAGDNNQAYDVFLRDLTVDTNELISVRAPELPSLTVTGDSCYAVNPVSSDDGRYVVFSSTAADLAPNDTNRLRDVFVRDLQTGTNILVSVATNGLSPASGYSMGAVISPDGRYVAFNSTADSLVNNDTNRQLDVFVRDIVAGTTTLVTVATNGLSGSSPFINADVSGVAALSSDGRYVLFASTAGGLVPGLPAAASNPYAFVRDLQVGTTMAVMTNTYASLCFMSRDGQVLAISGGASGNSINIWKSNSVVKSLTGTALALSGDGRRVAYASSTNVLFIYDLAVKTNLLVTANVQFSSYSQFSTNGRWLVYTTTAPILSNDTNSMLDIYVYDYDTGTNELISQSYGNGYSANGRSDNPAISPDGRFVSYRSNARNIVPGVTNGGFQWYLHDRQSGVTTVIGSNAKGGLGNARAHWPTFSGDSQTLFFRSFASDLIVQDFNLSADIFSWKLASSDLIPVFAGQMVFAPTSGQNPTLTWPVVAGKTYQVQFKDNLTDPVWLPLNGSVTIVGDHGYATDFAPNAGQRFYRVKAN
jgi:Tol biopolymer transport system component